MAYSWDPKYPTTDLPEPIRTFYKDEAKRLYDDLISRKLTIRTCPLQCGGYGKGHKIKVVEQHNPLWYSEFYKSFKLRKKKKGYTKGDTRKKRGNGIHTICDRKRVETALLNIIEGSERRLGAPRRKSGQSNLYQTLMRKVIHENLIAGYCEQEIQQGIQPNNEVRRFFGLEEVKLDEFWIEQGFAILESDEVPF